MGLNWLDLVLTVMLLSATVTGYRKGFVDQLLSLAVLIIALTCARFFAPQMQAFTIHLSETYAGQLAWGAAFTLLVLLGTFVQKKILTRRGRGGGIDGVLGAGFSLIVNAVVLSIVLNFIVSWTGMKDKSPNLIEQSKITSTLLPLAETFMDCYRDWET